MTLAPFAMASSSNARISPYTGEFTSAELEEAFLESQKEEFARRFRTAAALFVTGSALYIYLDYNNIGGGSYYLAALACRLLTIASAVWVFFWQPRTASGWLRATALSVTGVFVGFMVVNAIYLVSPADLKTLLRFVWLAVFVSFNCIYIPHRLRNAALTSGFLAVGFLTFEFALGDLDPSVGPSVLMIVIAAYVFGLQFARVLNRSRRVEYALLHALFPSDVVRRLKNGELVAEQFESASVMFIDIVGFTVMSSEVEPSRLVRMLDAMFQQFDRLVERLGAEKIKTIGDCYMVAAGVPIARDDHAEVLAALALEIRALLRERPFEGRELQVRIGMHSGPLVAGVIGRQRQLYDLWGDTVNVASRMESHGAPGEIQVSRGTYELLADQYEFEARGTIEVKGKGAMEAYYLIGPRAAA